MKKKYSFEMEVTGTAVCYVIAESEEEAFEMMERGDWKSEEGSQETEWNLPDWGDIGRHLLNIDEEYEDEL